MVNSNLTSRAGGNAIVNLSGILLPPTLRPSNPFPDGASTLLHPSLIRAKIVFETRGRVGRQFDKLAPAIVGIVYLHEQLCLAKLVDQPQRSAGRRGRSEAKGARCHLLALAFVNEEVDQHVPGRFAEELWRPDQLSAELAALIGSARICERG